MKAERRELIALLGEMQTSPACERVAREFNRLLKILGATDPDNPNEIVALVMIARQNVSMRYGASASEVE